MWRAIKISEEVTVEPEAKAPEVGITQGKFCASCGSQINEKAVICPKCGVAVKSIVTGEKNPGTAAVLSFLFTGLGQIYNGEIGKGILMMVVQMVNVALMFVVVGFITFPLLWIYGIYDANKRAKEINAQ